MDRFFQYLNLFPMPVWLAMMFAPRHALTERVSRSGPLFMLVGLNYILALFLAVRRARQAGSPLDLMTLDGIRAGIGTREGAVTAWAHMLALDLFAGAWIYRECRRLDAPGWIRIPALFATLMAGPAGLTGFLAWRAIKRDHVVPSSRDS